MRVKGETSHGEISDSSWEEKRKTPQGVRSMRGSKRQRKSRRSRIYRRAKRVRETGTRETRRIDLIESLGK